MKFWEVHSKFKKTDQSYGVRNHLLLVNGGAGHEGDMEGREEGGLDDGGSR